MNANTLKTVLIVILCILASFAFFSKNTSLKNAKRNTEELTHQVDSLKTIAVSYQVLKAKYDSLYVSLEGTRDGVVKLREKVIGLSKTQTAGLTTIRKELLNLINQFDTLRIETVAESSDLNPLKF